MSAIGGAVGCGGDQISGVGLSACDGEFTARESYLVVAERRAVASARSLWPAASAPARSPSAWCAMPGARKAVAVQPRWPSRSAMAREELTIAGDHALARWRYDWTQDGGGHVRGVGVFCVRSGKVAEKFSHVKG